MRMRRLTALPLIVLAVGIGTGATALAADEQNPIDLVRGGQMYDNWWKAANVPEPVGDHPLYPAIGQKTGSTTWRCKECHGWDYKGVDGAYGSGSHFTGITGVFGSTLTAEEMFDLIKDDTGTFGHGYGNAGLSDEDISDIVDFLQNALVDTDTYIDGAGAFIGDSDNGRWGYMAAGNYYNCAHCHGADGTEINFGTELAPEYVSDVANDNPWELLHKVRFGQPASLMTSWLLVEGDVQGAADVGLFIQSGFPVASYVGDEACKACHENSPTPDFWASYRNSGHPYKLFHNAGAEPPADTWPHSPVPPLPMVFGTQLQWSDVEYVIGNYNWKARFVDRQGYIWTGDVDDRTQWNLATEEWVPYHAGQVDKPYNCGRCHTTGYQPEGNQLGLPGLIGTWTEEGVRCEACHGPGSDHVTFPEVEQMLPAQGKTCAECHYRDNDFRMPWKGGFTRHHQQAEDFSHSPHANKLTCNTCHDPHRSTVNHDGGTITSCTDCHEGSEANSFYVVDEMEDVTCIDCHMPHMGKNAVAVNAYKGDIRAHLFRITREPLFAVDNVYDDNGSLFWNQEANGNAFLTLDYACMGCHIEEGENVSMEELSEYAVRIHTDHRAALPLPLNCAADLNGDEVLDFFDVQAFLGAFASGDPVADFNEDDTIDFFDLQEFLQAFADGCP
jgi:cytochrome c554/c'-like protein